MLDLQFKIASKSDGSGKLTKRAVAEKFFHGSSVSLPIDLFAVEFHHCLLENLYSVF